MKKASIMKPICISLFSASIAIIGLLLTGNSDFQIAKAASKCSNIAQACNLIDKIETKQNKLCLEESPVGTITAYGGPLSDKDRKKELAKKGWLFCNGDSYSRETWKQLFQVIGTAYGAKDKFTFRTPDLRGRFARGVDYGEGRDPLANDRDIPDGSLNKSDEVGSTQQDAFKNHSHEVYGFIARGGNVHIYGSGKYGQVSTVVTSEQGGQETRPKNIYVNWIIKASSSCN